MPLRHHPRALWALSSPRPVRESLPILAREALEVARRHPAAVQTAAAIAGTAVAFLAAYTGALFLARSMEPR